MKHFDLKEYINDFKALQLSLVYSFDNPNEQLTTVNKSIIHCIGRQAPSVKSEFTHPPAASMRQLDIADLQWKRANYRYLVGHAPEENWTNLETSEMNYTVKSKKQELPFIRKFWVQTAKKFGK